MKEPCGEMMWGEHSEQLGALGATPTIVLTP